MFMEQRLAGVWTCLLGAGLFLAFTSVTSKAIPAPPKLIKCEFIQRSNVTCYWEPGDNPATFYTLEVVRVPSSCGIHYQSPNCSKALFTCSTSRLSCTASLTSGIKFDFCITVISHSVSGNVSSEPRCQPARKEVILHPAILDNVQQVNGSPKCLKVFWSTIMDFSVTETEIKQGNLNSQIEFAVKGQANVQVRNVTVTGYSFLVCFFSPDTFYRIRLRHRYQGPASPWSKWSNACEGTTAEDVPSAAPVLWREVVHASRDGGRLISLLWKPLPRLLANGRVRRYNVYCRTENGQILKDNGSCRTLLDVDTSCRLALPAVRCSCALTASTSAGTSPEDRVWIPGSSETEPPPPVKVTVEPLAGNRSMEVRWTSPPNLPVSGFVVEWLAVREKTSSVLYWEKLNSSCTKLVITDGVKPAERYAVSVKALYGEQGAGKNVTLHVYTLEGTPSAGPNVQVEHISGSLVELSWSPVPVELLHGFIRNYTLYYTTNNQPAKSITVPGHVHRYTLENMSPGIYDIFMSASTIAGTGPTGNRTNVHIGSEETSIVIWVVVPLLLMLVVLMVMVLLAQMKFAKRKLFHRIPDPSNSSLSRWNPQATCEGKKLVVEQEKPEVSFPEVIVLDKLQDLERTHSYVQICNPQILPYLHSSLPPTIASAKGYITNMAKTPSANDLATSPCIYSNVLCNQLNQSLPPLVLPPSYQYSQNGTVHISDLKEPPDGDSESLAFEFASSDLQRNFRLFLEQLESHKSQELIVHPSYFFIRQSSPD
uniref:Interleukin-6 receptor subunit beta-like n=1 Tax=Cyprinodon variegatus TaxID=28743 RepID=A0A3Q2CKF2_CYPVA